MRKVIFFPGYACTSKIWDETSKIFDNEKCIVSFVDWPEKSLNNFTKIEDFSNWVEKEYDLKDSILVGHSMGGLVAFNIAKRNDKIDKLILVESFLKTPNKFFQNLYLEGTSLKIKDKINTMLKKESKYYSKELGPKLKDLDLTIELEELGLDVTAIYGQRESSSSVKVVKNLGLDEVYHKYLKIKTISKSSHFPMIENSEAFNKIILESLNE